MNTISIVLPAYKRSYLKESIQSLLAQTYRDFELIVVDDCSPENLVSVVDEFQDPRISYHRSEVNIGGTNLVAAWNLAMKYAHGEWCVLASDDDVYHVQYLERMVALVAKYPHCDLVHSRIATINGSGEVTSVCHGRIEYESATQFIYARVMLGEMLTAQEYMFRIAALKKIGGFVSFARAWFSDEATWFLLSRNGVACSSMVLFYWRISGENITSRKDDIPEKITAAEAYLHWAKQSVPNLLSQNSEEDKYLYRVLLANMQSRNEGVIRTLVIKLPLVKRIFLICSNRFSLHMRIRFVYDLLRCNLDSRNA